ncbi:hypothetical protein B0A67_13280 [Flavobacterium aquidurense]|uniref:hypothetical protein n=1 Tax=Flavobacterium aquidurense TaxID=362413 RepID=UPI00091371AD|nr:hypothetical protein [Flavobacterium aquidurense]OXA71229.1 hypothetical protein B0A67_13280 [Flavobacterium aquidurense]SHG69079.1 hypothetical protein SAMN05444481_106206 [Flavobacterium frigidimaris]
MKSLNDNLREEFGEILKTPEITNIIIAKKLDDLVISNAFEKLLDNKYGADDSSAIEKGRAEFETFIINTLKTKNH